jgi:hypothetical protein
VSRPRPGHEPSSEQRLASRRLRVRPPQLARHPPRATAPGPMVTKPALGSAGRGDEHHGDSGHSSVTNASYVGVISWAAPAASGLRGNGQCAERAGRCPVRRSMARRHGHRTYPGRSPPVTDHAGVNRRFPSHSGISRSARRQWCPSATEFVTARRQLGRAWLAIPSVAAAGSDADRVPATCHSDLSEWPDVSGVECGDSGMGEHQAPHAMAGGHAHPPPLPGPAFVTHSSRMTGHRTSGVDRFVGRVGG